MIASFAFAPGAAEAAGGAYVAAQGTQVAQYVIDAAGELSHLTPPTVTAGTSPTYIAVSPDGKSAYVTDHGAADVFQFDIDPLTGALSPKAPASVAAGTIPGGIAVSPNGGSAYVANLLDDNVSQYDVDPLTGALSPKAPASVAAGDRPVDVAVTPDGESAYVVNSKNASDTISQYDIDPLTGALSPKTPASVPTLNRPSTIEVTPDGRSAYVPIIGLGDEPGVVAQYDVDPVTGTLSPKSPPTIPTGTHPDLVAITPDGTSVYVTNSADSAVAQYDVDAVTGALSPKTPATVATGVDPRGVAVTLDGKYAYVTNFSDHNVSMYDIDPSTGSLSPKTPATIGAGGAPAPYGVAIGPEPPGGYPRPKSASTVRASLTPAYRPCTAAAHVHGPPLEYDSCNPPVQASPNLTVGTPDANGAGANATGSVKFALLVNPAPTPNDFLIQVVTNDVRCRAGVTPCGPVNSADGPDYTGELQATAEMRITDKLSGPSQTVAATVSDISFPATLTCTATGATVGASCSVSTSANALAPGAVQTGKRAIWEVGQVEIIDGGPDGVVSTLDNSVFQRQGIFLP